MAITCKGKCRERWLQPQDKFKSKYPIVELVEIVVDEPRIIEEPAEEIVVETPEIVEPEVVEAEVAKKPVEGIIVEGILIEKPKHRGRKKKLEEVAEELIVEEPQDESEEDPWAV